MKRLEKLEQRLGFLAVPNVVLTLIVAQLFIYAAILIGHVDLASIILAPKAVLGGEWWRLVSFLLAPPYIPLSPFQAIFLAFFWYIFWMMSQQLEAAWGVIRFNAYLIITILLAVSGAFLGQFISPATTIIVSISFLYYSIFFAFATLNPNIQFLIFFVVPMKVKWLAWITFGIGFFSMLALPSIGHRIAFVAPFLGYLLFFGRSFKQSAESRQRRAQFESERKQYADAALHTCTQCSATEKTHPERDFRYKTVDGDMVCICEQCRNTEV